MKNPGDKILIFYHFQLDGSKEMNVTSLPKTNTPITVKEAIMALPLDLSQGLYHFRFKSDISDSTDKMMAWLDIDKLQAKAPLINGAIHIKILKLKEASQNKVYHIEKIKKAGIIKHTNHSNSHHHEHHDIHSAPKNIHANNQSGSKVNGSAPKPQDNKAPVKKTSPSPTPIPSRQQPSAPVVTRPPPPPPPPSKVPSSPPVRVPSTPPSGAKQSQSLFDFEEKPLSKEVKQKLQTFEDQFTEEEQNRQNERISQIEFQDKIKQWGYTDMKKINNTTTLLATLHTIWPEWEPVSLTDMLTQEKVNSLFKKAVIKVHPDKNRQRHFKEKYLSKRIFQLLNESRNH